MQIRKRGQQINPVNSSLNINHYSFDYFTQQFFLLLTI